MKNIIRLLIFTIVLFNVTLAQTALIKTEALQPHRLTTLGFTTNSVSSGLNVVPNLTYVYLSAWNIGNDEPISSATFTLISKPASSTADLESINLTWAQFKPDVIGTYTVQLSITTASGSHDTTAKIYSSTFVGVGGFMGTSATFPQCMSCHQENPKFVEIYDRWKVSGHANVFNEQLEISDHYSASCMKCHTTGYDHSLVADNNGFDDIANSLGWSYIAPGNDQKWDSLVTYYPTLVNHATIGCESCHGPGREHAYGGHVERIAINLNAGVCAQCHDEPWRHNKYSEFENSAHSEAVWERTTGANANTNNLGDCIRCHDGAGFANFTKGLTTNAISWTEGLNATRITCAACHDPHGNSNEFSLRSTPAGSDTLGNGYQYTTGGLGRICMNCHKARVDNVAIMLTPVTQRWGPHHSVQADVFFAQNAADFGTPFNSGYHKYALFNACVDCHMVATADTGTANRDKVGGHSFNLHNEETDYDHTTACISCHGEISSFDAFEASQDYDADGTLESVSEEIAGLETLLRTWLPPVGIDSISWQMIRDNNNPNEKKAYWNYQLIANDGSKGMHNARFAIDVLTKSILAIGGTVDVKEDKYGSPTDYTILQNYPNPFNPSTTILYNIPFDSDVKLTVYNITGEVVTVLVNSLMRSGLHEVKFDTNGKNLSSGIYFYTIEANTAEGSKSFRETKKMILLK